MKTLLIALTAVTLTYAAHSQAQQGTDSQMQTSNIQGQDLSRDQGNGTSVNLGKQAQEENFPRRTSDEGDDLIDGEDEYEDTDEDLDSDY